MAAANRRAYILELELKNKQTTHKATTKQLGDLEHLTLKMERELHEERQKRAELEIAAADSITKAEVAAKLKLAEGVVFENEQLKLQLSQQRDLMRVAAKQSENLERMLKRRQEERRHMQETIRWGGGLGADSRRRTRTSKSW